MWAISGQDIAEDSCVCDPQGLIHVLLLSWPEGLGNM